MAQDSHQVQYQELTIGGRKNDLSAVLLLFSSPSSEIVSTLHERPRKATHYNTIRADRIIIPSPHTRGR